MLPDRRFPHIAALSAHVHIYIYIDIFLWRGTFIHTYICVYKYIRVHIYIDDHVVSMGPVCTPCRSNSEKLLCGSFLTQTLVVLKACEDLGFRI